MRTNRSDIRTEAGTSMVGYVLVAAGIAVASILSLGMLGRSTSESFTDAGEQLDGGELTAIQVESTEMDETDASVETPPETGDAPEGGDSDGAGSGGSESSGSEGASGGGGAASEESGGSGALGADDGLEHGADEGGQDGAVDASVEATPDQEATAGLFAEFSVSFEERDGALGVGSVSAGAWRHEVVKDTGTRIHLLFTEPDGDQVLVKGWLSRKGVLKTRTKILDD